MTHVTICLHMKSRNKAIHMNMIKGEVYDVNSDVLYKI